MNRLFSFCICILFFQIITANSLLATGSVPPKFPASQVAGYPLKSYNDTTFAHAANQFQFAHETIIERRLDSIKKDIPLDYNEFVQNYIDLYTHNRDEMAHVIGLSKYYFPIYEKVFHDAGIPREIEYLSIVESKLDPNAVSRVGATGPWQFMSTTAKLYGLNMDNYVDERRDPVRASYAAAAYLKDAYQEFGDWLLAIASYNCGKSNVENAMAKSGGTDFWSIRQYLPLETRNYVPAYIAVAYVMNYYNRHNIVPQACGISLNIDTVLVDKYVTINSISNILNIDARQLALLNPGYTMQVINGTTGNPRKLMIPQVDKDKYAALYNALNNGSITAITPQKTYVSYVQEKPEPKIPAYHKVRKGETLAEIADKYGVDVDDLRSWNHLHHNKAVTGQKLKLSAGGNDDAEVISTKINHNYITYKVKAGDTLGVIASKFDGSSVEKIRSLNGLKKARLQPGMTLKISRG